MRFYDANRWGVLSGQAFAPGERAGFMVSAGDARPAISDSVHERSNIVTIAVPADGVGHFAFGEPPAELPHAGPAARRRRRASRRAARDGDRQSHRHNRRAQGSRTSSSSRGSMPRRKHGFRVHL
jgi:hypothetical protein